MNSRLNYEEISEEESEEIEEFLHLLDEVERIINEGGYSGLVKKSSELRSAIEGGFIQRDYLKDLSSCSAPQVVEMLWSGEYKKYLKTDHYN